MTDSEARIVWQDVVAQIKGSRAAFLPWRTAKKEIGGEIKEFTANLIRAFSKGLIDFMAYSPQKDAVVLVPKTKIPNVDFILVYETDDGFTYFGMSKTGEGLKEITKTKVKLSFAGI